MVTRHPPGPGGGPGLDAPDPAPFRSPPTVLPVTAPSQNGAMARWNPWRALRASTVVFWFAPLDGLDGRWERRADGVDEVLIEESLGRRARREVLAHELVHVERGVGWPHATAATMQLEEERVWREALVRLAPADEVVAFVRARATVGGVTAADVAEEFDLTERGARRLLGVLRARGLLTAT